MGVQSRFGCASGRARDSSWSAKNRPKTDLGTPRASQERPTASQIRPRDGFETLPDRLGTLSERVWSFEHCRTPSPNDFFTFFGDRAHTPMCFLYQFLQCFVGFGRSSSKTRATVENPGKSSRFGLRNRARGRPSDPKSSSGAPVRAPKREKRARSSSIFFFVGANGLGETKNGASDRRNSPTAPKTPELCT